MGDNKSSSMSGPRASPCSGSVIVAKHDREPVDFRAGFDNFSTVFANFL